MEKFFKSLMKAIIIILVIAIIAIIFVGNNLYEYALKAEVKRTDYVNEFLAGNWIYDNTIIEDGSQEFSDIIKNDEKQELLKWAEKLYEKVSLESYDNLKLNGYFYKNRSNSNTYVIVVHGYRSQALDMLKSTKLFYDYGYNVIAVDCRGHGESEGKYIGMGWNDRKDIISWINYINSTNKNAKVVLYGVSMGASAVMMASGENLTDNVKCIIEDSGYTSAKEILEYQLKITYNLPSIPFMNAAEMITTIRAGYRISDASAIKQVEKSKTPTLFIHGSQDDFVPYEMVNRLYVTAKCEKKLYVVSGARHVEGSKIAGQAYWDEVFSFINKYL